MNSFNTLLLRICLFVSFSSCVAGFGNNAVYEQRRLDYITAALNNFVPDAITLQAYNGVPLDTGALNSLLRGISTGVTSDFDIVKLIRVLYFTNGQYDTLILPVLNQVPYWINYGDNTRTFWSENHMIMWMSSDWLLHEKYGRAIDSTLHKRLVHYLQLKVQYGYYEFFSSVYSPYCLSGLLNLADFAQDTTIKNLATQASQLLLEDMLRLTNDQGTFFPTAGRNYYGKYETPYGQNHNNLIYLLTGFGPAPGYGSHAGSFLASSTVPVDTIIRSWVPILDTVYQHGHSLDSGFVLNSAMSEVDKVVFQWSCGAYFHPEVALETYYLLTDSNLWHNVDFTPFSFLSVATPASIPSFAASLSSMSESSVICGEDIAIYKHNSITLSSVQDFWKGKVGYQEFPCVANVGTTPVFTASGKVQNWDKRSADNANNDLPYVQQKKNIALLMYRPDATLATVGYNHPEVSIFWQAASFDEVRTDSMWLLGRQGSNYVGVRRNCVSEMDSFIACDIANGQAWVIMVGDSVLYGSFNNFQNILHQSQFTESWYYDSITQQNVFYAKIVVDASTLEYAWGIDSVTTGIENVKSDDSGFKIFPNPANDAVNIKLTGTEQNGKIEIYNTAGQLMYQGELRNGVESVSAQKWSSGLYAIKLFTDSNTVTSKRFVVSH